MNPNPTDTAATTYATLVVTTSDTFPVAPMTLPAQLTISTPDVELLIPESASASQAK